MSSEPRWAARAWRGIPWWRRAPGILVALAVPVLAVLYVLGAWNPWRLVILQERFANPWLGLAVVAAVAYLALWLMLPITNEALQRGRIAARVAAATIAVIGVIVGANLDPLFRYQGTELARSPDGERAVAVVISGGLAERDLRVWRGSAPWTREVGSLGRPCGGISVRFVDGDTIVVNQGYGDWWIDLDPDTGRPLQVLAPRCPVPPVPAER
jgi:hypothetical protein